MQKPLRMLWLVAGYLFLLLGMIGALLPVMPTTVFLIMAVACFSRGNPALSQKLLDHPRFGPPLRLWQQHRAMTRRSKTIAICTITLSIGFSSYQLHTDQALLGAGLVAFGLGLIIWMVRLPSPPTTSSTCATIESNPSHGTRHHGSEPERD